MHPRQRVDPSLNRRPLRSDVFAPRQPDHGFGERQGIFGPMVDFLSQQVLALFGKLAFGDIDGDATDAHDVAVLVDARSRGADAPARLTVGPIDPKLRL